MSSNTPADGTAGGTNSGTNNNSNSNNNNNTNNGNRNNRPPWRGGNQTRGGADALRNFKGAIESLPVLGTKVEKSSQDSTKFNKAILNHVLTNFTYPQDIAMTVTDFKDPMNKRPPKICRLRLK